MTDDRKAVRELRRQYGRDYCDQINQAVADAPPFTTSQLAFMRRCIRARAGAR